jgi:hypothetical protein
VLGANIDLGNCLNLIESDSLLLVRDAYDGLCRLIEVSGSTMPVNKGNNRALDCSVFRYIHDSNESEGSKPYDTIRCAFPEGDELYPGASIMDRLHIQIAVLNLKKITGYFLPRPLRKFNPYLHTP